MGEEADVHRIEVKVAPHRVVIDPERPRPVARPRSENSQVPFLLVDASHHREGPVPGDDPPDHLLKSGGIFRKEIVRQALDHAFIAFVEYLGESGITGQLMELAEKRIRAGRQTGSRRTAEPENRSEAIRLFLVEATAIAFLWKIGMKTPGIDVESEMVADSGMPEKNLPEEIRIESPELAENCRRPARADRAVGHQALFTRHPVDRGSLDQDRVDQLEDTFAVVRPTQNGLDDHAGLFLVREVGEDLIAMGEGVPEDAIFDVSTDGDGRILRIGQPVAGCPRLQICDE